MLQRVSNPVNIDVSLLRKLHKILTVFLFLFLVVSMDYSMEGTNITLAVFIPTAIVLVIVLGIYVYFVKWVTSLNFIYCICRQRRLCRMFSCFFFHSLLRLQGKSVRMPTSSPPYDNMTEESAFDNPIYESGVSTDVMSMQDIDSQNTSVLSWSSSIPLLSSQRHLISRQQRASSPSITISIISEIKYWTLWYHLPVGIFHTSFLYSGIFFLSVPYYIGGCFVVYFEVIPLYLTRLVNYNKYGKFELHFHTLPAFACLRHLATNIHSIYTVMQRW